MQPSGSDPAKSSAEPSEMARRVAEKAWHQTPLGPRDQWPQSLQTLVATILRQPLAAVLLWGPELVQIYNDAYCVIAGAKHPEALGQPTYQCWPEVMHWTRPVYERILAGESIYVEDEPLELQRGDGLELVYLTISYSPVCDDTGAIAGLLAIVVETTEKVRLEQDRRRIADDRERLAEQRGLALEAAQLGWWHYDLITGQVYWDARVRQIFGVTDHVHPYEEVLTRIHPEDRQQVDAAIRAATDPLRAEPYHVQYRLLHSDGSLRWVESRGLVAYEGEGEERQAIAFFGTAADVTATRRTEQSLREGTERLSLALAAAQLGDWEWDPATDLLTLSPRAAELYGVEPGKQYGREAMRSLLHEDYRDAARRASARAVLDRGDYDIEYPIRRASGDEVWIAAKGRGIYDANGRLIRMLGVVQDVTRRKRVEEEREVLLAKVASEHARLSALFSQSPAFMCYLSGPTHIFEFYNEEYAKLVGHRELLGKPVREALPEIVGQGYFELLSQVYASGERFVGADMPVRVQREPGQPLEERYVEFIYQPIQDGDGSAGIFVHGIDTTDSRRSAIEREQLLDAERAARAEAEAANRMKDDFLATLSHELRTPLNAIVGWSQLLRMGERDAEDLAEGLETIERNARAQAQIIEDLLDMSRIISGKIRLDVQRVNLAEVVHAGVDTIRPAADAKGLRIVTVIDPHVGAVNGDPNRLQQVVWNLLSNAAKFTNKGGLIQVTLERVNSHVEISVSDTGAGIDPAFLPNVFDRFRQADSSITRRHGGLGLGLSIVKQLVDLHGGTVSVKSAGLGQGATFSVSLPLSPVQRDPAASGDRRHPPSGMRPARETEDSIRLPGVRVLVVDDEPDARSLVKRILEDCEAVVETAPSAQAALQALRSGTFDVLVSDIGMPETDGYELIRSVRQFEADRGGSIPALALTAYARSEDRMRAIRAGFNMHVVKPIDASELLTMVASLATRK